MHPLNFGEGDFLNDFDKAPDPNGFDLSGFDAATGKTVVPAGLYCCRVERGELATTKAGKTAYRLCFKTVTPAEHAGYTLWRWFTLADAAGQNRAKKALAPLGLLTGDDLRRPFPPLGKDVFVRALVTVRNDPQYGETNDVERFESCDPPVGFAPMVNPFAAPLPTAGEGGPQQ